MYILITQLDVGKLTDEGLSFSENKETGKWYVGFYKPNGHFHVLEQFNTRDHAIRFMNRLNAASETV